MKKSELRKLIREGILNLKEKELVQTTKDLYGGCVCVYLDTETGNYSHDTVYTDCECTMSGTCCTGEGLVHVGSVKQMAHKGKKIDEQSPITNPFNDFLIWTQNNTSTFDWRCFGGMRQYAYTILKLPNFQSSNPNQPCNFIVNNRIPYFTNLLANAGPNSTSAYMWQCKLNFFNTLSTIYNC